jgi:hypothetical protein
MTAYFILTRIFGHSATDATIIVSLFSILSAFLIKINTSLYKLNRELGEFAIENKHCLTSINKRIDSMEVIIKNKLCGIHNGIVAEISPAIIISYCCIASYQGIVQPAVADNAALINDAVLKL